MQYQHSFGTHSLCASSSVGKQRQPFAAASTSVVFTTFPSTQTQQIFASQFLFASAGESKH
jgi:hypothetical protein